MRLLKKIKTLFIYILTFQFIKEYQYSQISKQSIKIAQELSRKRRNLKIEINDYVRINYGLDANSDFIPSKGQNKAKLYAELHHRYGSDMQSVSLTLTKNLRWR